MYSKHNKTDSLDHYTWMPRRDSSGGQNIWSSSCFCSAPRWTHRPRPSLQWARATASQKNVECRTSNFVCGSYAATCSVSLILHSFCWREQHNSSCRDWLFLAFHSRCIGCVRRYEYKRIILNMNTIIQTFMGYPQANSPPCSVFLLLTFHGEVSAKFVPALMTFDDNVKQLLPHCMAALIAAPNLKEVGNMWSLMVSVLVHQMRTASGMQILVCWTTSYERSLRL